MVQQLKVKNLLLVSRVVLNEEEVIVENGASADSEESVAG